MATQTQIRTETLARQLASKTPLDAAVDAAEAAAAAAFLLSKAGPSVSALRAQGGATLDALLSLDSLTGRKTRAAALWLALRALSLQSGDAVGLPRAMGTDPVLAALLAASGLGVSFEKGEEVAGTLNTAWNVAHLLAPGRAVTLDLTGGLTVRAGKDTLLSIDAASDARLALSHVDALGERAGAAAHTPKPLAYTTAEEAATASFTAEIFSPYALRRVAIPGAQAHPSALVESAALAGVLPPVPSYTPVLLPSVVASGALSDVQLEAVIYAGEAHSRFLPAHPNDPDLPTPRQGFLLGHGTGVGKGHILAGIMADNWAQGRRRHVWISESAHLVDAARADWVAMGGKASDVWDAREMTAQQPLPNASGIVFLTYAGLRSEHGIGRVAQLVSWMGDEDGVIAFDESQNLRHTLDEAATQTSWGKDASRQAKAAQDLQDRLPRARVIYSSATSASDVTGLVYAHRLGLWGTGTAFANSSAFVAAMEKGGTNALEMVARDMKAMGIYLSANLSFEGVGFERLEHRMDAFERQRHDLLANLWCTVADRKRRAVVTTGIQNGPASALGRDNRRPDTLFNMARARFFQATIAGMKTPTLIKAIRADLAEGKSAVVQLSNTFGATMERAIAAAEEAGDAIDQVTVTPRDILLGYLQDGFPIHMWETTTNAQGRQVLAPKRDANGDPMICPRALAERDALVAEVEATPMPEGPLEQLLDAFGPEMVAEVTGRARRLVPGPQGRVLEERPTDAIPRDIQAFMDGRKRVLVFSQAGAAGQTYSASRTRANRQIRRHYLLQAGWRADMAIQGMGRSHRSHQEQPPEYVLVSIDLWADQRMVSRVAKGMQNLGAITRGQRQAAAQGFFTQDENLEDTYAQEAWKAFVRKLHAGEVHGLTIGQFEREAHLKLREANGSLPADSKFPPVHRFLNAMSAMRCDSQAAFGQALREELVALRTHAIATGAYDRGLETIRPDSLIKLDDIVVHRDARSGGETRLLQMLRVDTLDPIPFEQARMDATMAGNALLGKSLSSGRVAVVCFPRSLREMHPSANDRVIVYTPTGRRERTRADVVAEGWQRVDPVEAAALWQAEQQERGAEEERVFWVISGTLLPIWDKMPAAQSTVYRMETDAGERIIGRLIDDRFVQDLQTRMARIATGGLDATSVQNALDGGSLVELANGWSLQGRIYADAKRAPSATVFLPKKEEDLVLRLKGKGVVQVRGGGYDTLAYRLPEGDARMDALQALLAFAPAVRILTL